MVTGILFDIKKFAIHDGFGLRTTIFFKGCPLKCQWCHNPESQAMEIQHFEDWNVGKVYTVHQVFEEIQKDRIFFDESGGGVTISGGEPFAQPEFLKALLQKLRQEGIHITLDTCGYVNPDIFKQLASMVNLFLYDLKFITDSSHQWYTGASNALILTNLRYLDAERIPVRVRFPLIPTINDNLAELERIRSFLLSLKSIHDLDILPYHSIGQSKYQKMGRSYSLSTIAEPTFDQLHAVQDFFQTNGLQVSIED